VSKFYEPGFHRNVFGQIYKLKLWAKIKPKATVKIGLTNLNPIIGHKKPCK
jgi:hypothetical protein